MTVDDIPTYNLKAVVQETGLKPDTLRAWERRYGIPEPDRTSGGHRLYSQQDINTLKWLLKRQQEGLSISRAVKLWHRIIEEGQDPFETMPLVQSAEPPTTYPSIASGDALVELRQSWIDACLDFDERRAERVLGQAFAYFSPEMVCFELLQEALVEIGNKWYEGTVTVQQEHFASALALRRMDTLLSATPPPSRPERILVGCPPGDNHTFGPLLLTFLLRRRGWDVVYLGADIPLDQLQATIEQTQPDLVIFAGQLLESAAGLLDIALFLANQKIPLAYGGYIFNQVPELRSRFPGHFLGARINQLPHLVEHLLINKPVTPAYEPISQEYQAAYTYFLKQHGLLESQVWQALGSTLLLQTDISQINRYMSSNVASALKLGDMNYMKANLRWIQGLITNHDMPAASLHHYLESYYQAAQTTLTDPAGRPILAWLENVVESESPAFSEI
ncbi:MAG: MerR family transcriptional regulator [Chloroflexota bacterium]